MDVYGSIFAVMIGAMAVVFANWEAFASDAVRRERYVKHGVLRPGDAPDVDAPAGYVARERARERQALLGSAVLVAVAVVMLLIADPPTVQTIAFVVLSAAFFGRSAVIAVLAGQEAIRQPPSGPRLSRGRLGRLGDYVGVTPWACATVAQVAFLVAYVPTSLAHRPDVAGWVVALAVISLVAAAGGWTLAWWLARQPQAAGSHDELAWSDATRRRDLTAMLAAGPFLAVGVSISAFTYDGSGALGDPVESLPLTIFAYLVVMVVLAVWGGVAAGLRERRERGRVHAER